MPASTPHITVLGGGVIGLTTALALEAAGLDVAVIAEHTGQGTVSAVAGAVWFPFRASPPGLINRWARRTFEALSRTARTDPDAGVDMLTFFQCVDTDQAPWYADAIERLAIARGGYFGRSDAPSRAAMAWTFPAPRVEPALFLPWLERRLRRPIVRGHARSFDDLPGDLIINCTGLGARDLTGDRELQGVYGHVLVVEPGDIPMDISISDDRDPAGIFYTIPRRDTVIVGGCAEPSPDGRPLAPDPAMREAILQRCRDHGFTPGRILAERVGLRPGRSSVRLERDPANPRVIHNYGHGGSGYTVMHGCAEDVAALALASLERTIAPE